MILVKTTVKTTTITMIMIKTIVIAKQQQQ